MGGPIVPEFLVTEGVEWLVLGGRQARWRFSQAANAFRPTEGCGVAPPARSHAPEVVARILEIGAPGIIAPRVRAHQQGVVAGRSGSVASQRTTGARGRKDDFRTRLLRGGHWQCPAHCPEEGGEDRSPGHKFHPMEPEPPRRSHRQGTGISRLRPADFRRQRRSGQPAARHREDLC